MRKCYYHPEQILHNFCVNKECALPLCPKCINPHLQQSSQNHHILPLQDIQQMIIEQVNTSIYGLKHSIQEVNENSHPQAFLKDYEELLAKYKKQEIEKVNRHFQAIQQQLRCQITNKYKLYLLPFLQTLQNSLKELQCYQKQIEQGKYLESIIKIVNLDTISQVQNLLYSFQTHKSLISQELPGLSYGKGGLIEVLPVFSHNKTFKHKIPDNKGYENVLRDINGAYEGINRTDKIEQLENKLITMRKGK